MAGREGLHGVLDPVRVPGADVRVVHEGLKAAAPCCTIVRRDDRFADRQEMRAETADGLLEDDLEKSACDEGKAEAENGGSGIVEASDAGVDLAEEDYGDGKGSAENTSGQGGEDRRDIWVGEVGINDVTGTGEGDGE